MGEVAIQRPRASLRERKRAATITEIKTVALTQLADEGGAMTLRGVAREVGMTVQSLYHYFPSRDDLITALVTDAHNGLADAVVQADRAYGRGQGRLVALTMAYRAWAIAHRAEFLLIYGTPIPGYRAPDPGPTTDAARRLGAAFVDAIFSGWTDAQLARLTLPKPDPVVAQTLATAAERAGLRLPPPAYGLMVELWGRMHGLVMLEVLRHTPWLAPPAVAAAYFEGAMVRAAADLDRIRTVGG